MSRSSSALGTRVRRIDAPEKLTGHSQFAADLRLPDMLYARLLLSPHAHARIVKIDGLAAGSLPGVIGVVTGDDLAPLIKSAPSSRARLVLAKERVLFCGQPVAAVLAETAAAAEDALAAIEVEYEALPACLDPLEALEQGAPAVWEEGLPGESAEAGMHATIEDSDEAVAQKAANVASILQHDRGDVEAGFGQADVIFQGTFRTPAVHQGYLEPHAALAAVNPMGRLTIWTSTQGLFYTREEVAETLGLAAGDVRVIATPVGGGFGGKVVLLQPLAAALAVYAKRPVSLVLTRTEDFLSSTPAPQAIIDLKLGAKRDGSLTALEARVVFDAGAFPGAPTGVTCLTLGMFYRIPNLRIRGLEVVTHKAPTGAYRAPGAVQGTYAIESAMDDVARQLGMDPLELRLRNVNEEGDPLPNGAPLPRIGLKNCLERLRDHRAWKNRPAARTPDEGIGVACGGWLGGLQPATAVCRVESDGNLSIVVGSVDLSGTNTGMALLAAEAFGVSPGNVRIVNADSDAAPFSGLSGGSKITLTTGFAVMKAAAEARKQLLAIAADQLEASVEDLEIADGAVLVQGAPSRSMPIARLAALSMQFAGKYEPIFGRGSVAPTERAPGMAAQLARVRVDPETGQTNVLELVAVQDVGKAVNPAGIEDQIHGGVAQGVGWALYERMLYDENGRLVSGSFLDYTVPGPHQTPTIEPVIVEVPSGSGPLGVRGVGEPPVVPAPAAVANAVRDAIGVRLYELPMTSERVLAAIRRRQ